MIILYPKPEQWAEGVVLKHGWPHALHIASTVGRPLIGQYNDSPNPHAPWYARAIKWIKTNAPPKAFETKENAHA